MQGKLDAIAKVLADARADADQVARALVQADRDLAAARAARVKAERRYRQARARRAQAMREALLAKLEVDAQQALIDRRARETYVNSAPSMVLTLLADADTIADLLDRTKLLGEVAEAANAELAGLVEARVEAEEASQRAAAAERSAADAKAVMRARAAEFEQIRAVRAAAKRALERKIASLQVRQASLRRQSTRILGTIRAEEAARRRAAQAAANRAGSRQGPTILHEDEHGPGRPERGELPAPDADRQAPVRAGDPQLRHPRHRGMAAHRIGARKRPSEGPGLGRVRQLPERPGPGVGLAGRELGRRPTPGRWRWSM